MKRITISNVMEAKPCHRYTQKKVEELFAKNAAELAELDISVEDRLWVVLTCCLNDKQRLSWAKEIWQNTKATAKIEEAAKEVFKNKDTRLVAWHIADCAIWAEPLLSKQKREEQLQLAVKYAMEK